MLVVDVDKEAHPCIAISEDNDGIGIQVSVLGREVISSMRGLSMDCLQEETLSSETCLRRPSPAC